MSEQTDQNEEEIINVDGEVKDVIEEEIKAHETLKEGADDYKAE